MVGENQNMSARPPSAADKYVLSLPPGYQFQPCDAELVLQYLKKKISNEQLPINRIHSTDIYKYHPEDLIDLFPKLREDGWYFFSTRQRKYENGSRPNRKANRGYWKATGSDKDIFDKTGQVIGHKKVLEFHNGTHKQKEKTEWKMHEIRIKDKEDVVPRCKRKSGEEGCMKLDTVLCKIYLNTRAKKGDAEDNNSISPTETQVTSDDKDVSVEHEAVPDQPLVSSPIRSKPEPKFHNNTATTGGFIDMDHNSRFNSTILDNRFYSSAPMSERFCGSTGYVGPVQNEALAYGSVYHPWGSYSGFSNHQNYTGYIMYSEHMPSSSSHQLPFQYVTDIPTQSQHEIPLLNDSTYVSLPAHVNEYQSMLIAEEIPNLHVNNDVVDDDEEEEEEEEEELDQFLSILDDVHEKDPDEK